jgi:hypothetical protein
MEWTSLITRHWVAGADQAPGITRTPGGACDAPSLESCVTPTWWLSLGVRCVVNEKPPIGRIFSPLGEHRDKWQNH